MRSPTYILDKQLEHLNNQEVLCEGRVAVILLNSQTGRRVDDSCIIICERCGKEIAHGNRE